MVWVAFWIEHTSIVHIHPTGDHNYIEWDYLTLVNHGQIFGQLLIESNYEIYHTTSAIFRIVS